MAGLRRVTMTRGACQCGLGRSVFAEDDVSGGDAPSSESISALASPTTHCPIATNDRTRVSTAAIPIAGSTCRTLPGSRRIGHLPQQGYRNRTGARYRA